VNVDGTCVSMPDTPANQKAYPQHFRQKRGCGFPMARIVVLLSLATGAMLDLAVAPWSGKLTGEHALLRGLRDRLRRGDILLGDSYYSSFEEVAALLRMGVDVVMRQHGGRPTESVHDNRRTIDRDNRWNVVALRGTPGTGGLFSGSSGVVVTPRRTAA
jgi:hypothetical protein